jgi:hypothetical protein
MRLSLFLVLISFSLLSGCSGHHEALLISPEKQVSNHEPDESLRQHINRLEKGPIVEGDNCLYLLLNVIPLTTAPLLEGKSWLPDYDRAYAEAISKAGHGYNALANVELDHNSYMVPLLFSARCFTIKGTAVKYVPYNSAARTQ